MSNAKRKAKESRSTVRKPKHAEFDRAAIVAHLVESKQIADSDLALLAVNEYFDRFMPLKKAAKDADATILSPSYLVDLVWHAAILDTAGYAQFCENQIGFFVHHRHFDGDEKAREQRYERTYKDYKDTFGAPDDLMWPHPDSF
jgi:hypothetical protein